MKLNKPEKNAEWCAVTFFNMYRHSEAETLLSTHLAASNDFDPAYLFNGYVFIFNRDVSAMVKKTEVCFSKGKYDPFTVYSKLKFGSNHGAAQLYIEHTIRKLPLDYIRIGCDYFKKTWPKDRHGSRRLELKPWLKGEIRQDFNADIFNQIPKVDSFTIDPNNIDHQEIIDGDTYNTYAKIIHEPKPGKWKWTEILLRHVFAEHYELGLRYMQVLYLHPKQALPMLVLASVERATGKTTFLNWVAQIFGANYTVLNPEDVTASFNESYAEKNIIAIEETKDERTTTVNKLKNLSTTKYVNVNKKHVSSYTIPFYGKFIITTNEPKRFLRVDEEEIRLWVRLLPSIQLLNTQIEEDLIREIPAFLHHLTTLPAIDFSKSRMVFTAEEVKTDALKQLKVESRSELHKEIEERIKDVFTSRPEYDFIEMSASDIHDLFLNKSHRYGVAYISKVLRENFGLEQQRSVYHPLLFDEMTKLFLKDAEKRLGRYYTFKKEDFNDEKDTTLLY